MTDVQRLTSILRRSPRVMTVLTTARDVGLPDPLLFSGAVYQTVWNALTDRPSDYGIKDYDLGYFDDDLSLDAEDRAIKRMAASLQPPLRTLVEVRNQARVHLWFEEHYGRPYAALHSTADALNRALCTAHAVGVRLEPDDSLRVHAPMGLDDVFAMRLRPSALYARGSDWDKVVASTTSRWPEVHVDF